MRIYHFVNQKYGLDNLRRKRLKIATVHDLNDPFELIGPSTNDPALRAAFRRLKDELAATRGMVCFSRDWRNPVQWSHYADRHRGMCLAFDVPDEHLSPVRYTRKRLEPEVDALIFGGAEAERVMLRILTTKYSHWRYENEVRTFAALDDRDPETNLYFVDFGPSLTLREVIIGHSSELLRAELLDALGDLAPAVSMRKARLAFRSFRVVNQTKRSLWI